ncbi:MAG: tRNA (N6-isopentenyl adenosine(37)-C2)-methylthiotransferase MiaB [Syntrophomonadaceae bacterium]|nr:tRNA (N6-isopentenyl adenosine(37)-C2)-methylthiotransferase MiaB [Syntrophomonadaceae bacterium]
MTGAAAGRRYAILTYGCQMNERDSETLAGLVEAAGYREGQVEEADLVIFNTCSVRHSAENKVYGKLGELKALKRERPGLLIAFGGCMAQMADVRARLRRMGVVDIVFGTHNLHELPRLLAEAEAGPAGYTEAVWDQAGAVVEGLPARRRPGVGAFVNIMYGCNNFCSYCVVPYTRGRERSRHPQAVVEEVRGLVAAGVREVTLLGQNVNSYGRGLEPPVDFADLLAMVQGVDGLCRLRFTTSHPRDMSQRLLEAIRRLPAVCEHVHAPLQAGSDRVLQAMNRGYTRQQYFELVERMRETVPGVAVTSDLIVGFPGESDEDFADTLDAVQRIRFDGAFTFMYSPRAGTRAAAMPLQVPLAVKRERLAALNRVQYGIALAINQQLQGRQVEVLVEGPSRTNPERLTGRTRSNRIVVFEGPEHLTGTVVAVRVVRAQTFTLVGQLTAQEGGGPAPPLTSEAERKREYAT